MFNIMPGLPTYVGAADTSKRQSPFRNIIERGWRAVFERVSGISSARTAKRCDAASPETTPEPSGDDPIKTSVQALLDTVGVFPLSTLSVMLSENTRPYTKPSELLRYYEGVVPFGGAYLVVMTGTTAIGNRLEHILPGDENKVERSVIAATIMGAGVAAPVEAPYLLVHNVEGAERATATYVKKLSEAIERRLLFRGAGLIGIRDGLGATVFLNAEELAERIVGKDASFLEKLTAQGGIGSFTGFITGLPNRVRTRAVVRNLSSLGALATIESVGEATKGSLPRMFAFGLSTMLYPTLWDVMATKLTQR